MLEVVQKLHAVAVLIRSAIEADLIMERQAALAARFQSKLHDFVLLLSLLLYYSLVKHLFSGLCML